MNIISLYVLFSLLTVTAMASVVVDVSSSCTSSCTGGNDQPYSTLVQAFEGVKYSPYVIYLRQGTYKGLNNKNMNLTSAFVQIIGDTSGSTVIDCENEGYAFELTSGTFYLSNIVIRNCMKNVSSDVVGNFSGGAAIALHSTYTELNNIIIQNSVSKGLGGSIYLYSNALKINNSIIQGGYSALFGGGVYAESADVEIYNTSITGNSDRTGKNDIFCFNGSVNLYNNSTAEVVFCQQCSITSNQKPLCQGSHVTSDALKMHSTTPLKELVVLTFFVVSLFVVL